MLTRLSKRLLSIELVIRYVRLKRELMKLSKSVLVAELGISNLCHKPDLMKLSNRLRLFWCRPSDRLKRELMRLSKSVFNVDQQMARMCVKNQYTMHNIEASAPPVLYLHLVVCVYSFITSSSIIDSENSLFAMLMLAIAIGAYSFSKISFRPQQEIEAKLVGGQITVDPLSQDYDNSTVSLLQYLAKAK